MFLKAVLIVWKIPFLKFTFSTKMVQRGEAVGVGMESSIMHALEGLTRSGVPNV